MNVLCQELKVDVHEKFFAKTEIVNLVFELFFFLTGLMSVDFMKNVENLRAHGLVDCLYSVKDIFTFLRVDVFEMICLPLAILSLVNSHFFVNVKQNFFNLAVVQGFVLFVKIEPLLLSLGPLESLAPVFLFIQAFHL